MNDNGNIESYNTKEEFLEALSAMIDICEEKGESHFAVGVDTLADYLDEMMEDEDYDD
jgi:hypothetical protein